LRKKFIIGTANFGFPYGISNGKIKVKKKEVFKILNYAKSQGIYTLDTAINYGQSEKILGEYGLKKWKVITKLPKLKNNHNLEKLIKKSLNNLKINQIDTLLFHDTKQIIGKNGGKIFNNILKLKKKGLIKKIGFSVYTPNQVRKIIKSFNFQVLQCPYNIIDRRMDNSGILKILKKKKIEIHVRSIFLKGLLLLKKNKIPKKFHKWKNLFNNYHNFTNDNKISAQEFCLNFVLSNKFVNKLVIGLNNKNQLKELISTKRKKINYPAKIQTSDTRLINPSNW